MALYSCSDFERDIEFGIEYSILNGLNYVESDLELEGSLSFELTMAPSSSPSQEFFVSSIEVLRKGENQQSLNLNILF